MYRKITKYVLLTYKLELNHKCNMQFFMYLLGLDNIFN